MTLQEASKNWNKSEETICKWVCSGYIRGVSIENDMLIFPNIPTPHTIRKNIKVTADIAYREILKACKENEYIDAALLRISGEHFELYIENLIQYEYLSGTAGSSNQGCVITPKGIEATKAKIKLNIPINNNIKIGIININ